MIGMDVIKVKKQDGSKISLFEIKELLKESIEKTASFTDYDIWNDGEKITIMFKKRPISLQTVNKVIHDLQIKKIRITKFSWEEHADGPVKRGRMEIIVS